MCYPELGRDFLFKELFNIMSNIIQEEIEKIRKMMLLENMVQEGGEKKLKETLDIDVQRAGIIWLKAQTRGESKKQGIYQGKGWQIKEVEDFDHNFELFKHVQAFFLEDNGDTMPNTIKIPTTLSL